MNDLQTRITEHVDSTAPPIDIDLLVEQLTHDVAPTRRLLPEQAERTWWWHRRWAPVLAGAVLVLLMVGGAALLRGPSEAPVITTPEETPTSTPLRLGTAGPWIRHDLRYQAGLGESVIVGSITAGSPGFIAAGNTWTRGDVWARGQIWTSTDGSSWTWVADDDRTLFEEGHWPEGVIASDTALIVWGANNRQGGTVIWRSLDGLVWSLVSSGEPPLDGRPVTKGLALASGGFLLYGAPADCILETGICTPVSAPRLLASPDGVGWEEVGTPVTFTAIVQTESGDLVATQRRASEPTTWISQDDGASWERNGTDHPLETGTPSVMIETMTATPFGLIAAGTTDEKRPVLWISDDGTSFTQTLGLPAGANIASIAYGQGWVVAVGSTGLDPAIWASQNGRDWRSVPLAGTYLGDGYLSDIAYRDSVFVAAGQHRAEIGGEALILEWSPAAG
jgi:hypothetical protein